MIAATAEDVRLFVRLLRPDHEAASRCLAARRAPIEALVDTAGQHGLSVVLHRALASSPLRQQFPPPQLERLANAHRRQLERTRRLLEALDHVASRFAAAGQRFMLLKGPYLASRFFGDTEGRDFVDLDLLVPRADRDRAFELLAEAGYLPKSRVLLSQRATCFFVHGFDFSDGATQVDLHWCLSRHPSLRVDEAAMWQRCGSYDIGGHAYDVLAEEDEILFAVLSLLRDLERGRPKIKNVVDLLQVLEAVDSSLDWPRLLATRRREGALGPLVNVLSLCLDVAAAHDLAPHLSAALAEHASRRVKMDTAGEGLAFRPEAYQLGNRLWCARAYDTPLLVWALWWGISLPFRSAVHRRPQLRAR